MQAKKRLHELTTKSIKTKKDKKIKTKIFSRYRREWKIIMSDRTGELCPFCKKGKLYPTGGRDILEPAIKPRSGESRRESIEYECDSCHRKTRALGLTLTNTMSTSVEVKVSGSNKIDDEKTNEGI